MEVGEPPYGTRTPAQAAVVEHGQAVYLTGNAGPNVHLKSSQCAEHSPFLTHLGPLQAIPKVLSFKEKKPMLSLKLSFYGHNPMVKKKKKKVCRACIHLV